MENLLDALLKLLPEALAAFVAGLRGGAEKPELTPIQRQGLDAAALALGLLLSGESALTPAVQVRAMQHWQDLIDKLGLLPKE